MSDVIGSVVEDNADVLTVRLTHEGANADRWLDWESHRASPGVADTLNRPWVWIRIGVEDDGQPVVVQREGEGDCEHPVRLGVAARLDQLPHRSASSEISENAPGRE